MAVTAKQIGRNICAERNRIGLTQAELARLIEVNPMTISNWENGQCAIPITKASAMADVFEIRLDTLAGRENRQ